MRSGWLCFTRQNHFAELFFNRKKYFYDFWRPFEWQKNSSTFIVDKGTRSAPLIKRDNFRLEFQKSKKFTNTLHRVEWMWISPATLPSHTLSLSTDVISLKIIRDGKLKSFALYDFKWWSRWNNPFVFTLNINGINGIEVVFIVVVVVTVIVGNGLVGKNLLTACVFCVFIHPISKHGFYLSINKNRFICKNTILEGYYELYRAFIFKIYSINVFISVRLGVSTTHFHENTSALTLKLTHAFLIPMYQSYASCIFECRVRKNGWCASLFNTRIYALAHSTVAFVWKYILPIVPYRLLTMKTFTVFVVSYK